jgi:hypothetical protein
MKLKKLTYVASVALAMCLINSASAQWTAWNGAALNGLWADPGNWTAGLPTSVANQGCAIDPSPGPYPTIVAGEVESVGTLSDHATTWGTIYGPEWGDHLEIYGTLIFDWALGPVQWDAANRSVINMYDNSCLYGWHLCLGDNWWWQGGPYVTMNMYSNSFAGVNILYWGGRLNLYDNAVLSITNSLTVRTLGAVSDATRFINLQGNAKLVLPSTVTPTTVSNWISRGILLVYGIPGDSPDIVIDTANVTWPGRTVVSTTATSAVPVLAVRIEAPRTNLYVGGLEQALVYADYSNNTNVNVTSLSGLQVTYSSSAPSVASVSAAGRVRALGAGTATVNVYFLGSLSNSITVTVAPYTNTASLVHRYSFSESGGSTTADSVGGVPWDGALSGGATLSGGQLALDGVSGYVSLPAGVVSNMDAITIEAWANFGAPAAFACLYSFGDFNNAASPQGRNYIMFQPFTGVPLTPTANMTFGTGDPGYLSEEDATLPLVAGGVTNYLGNVHLACVYHPYAGYVALYTNGVLAIINNDVMNMLATTLGIDPYNYLGLSLYALDPYLAGSIDEFRIYNGPLSAAQIAAQNALGPNQFIGTSTNVSLAAASAGGGSVTLAWSTNSALVTVMASPVLGTGANWTQVSGPLTVVGGNYHMTVPVSGTAQYFRLRL